MVLSFGMNFRINLFVAILVSFPCTDQTNSKLIYGQLINIFRIINDTEKQQIHFLIPLLQRMDNSSNLLPISTMKKDKNDISINRRSSQRQHLPRRHHQTQPPDYNEINREKGIAAGPIGPAAPGGSSSNANYCCSCYRNCPNGNDFRDCCLFDDLNSKTEEDCCKRQVHLNPH